MLISIYKLWKHNPRKDVPPEILPSPLRVVATNIDLRYGWEKQEDSMKHGRIHQLREGETYTVDAFFPPNHKNDNPEWWNSLPPEDRVPYLCVQNKDGSHVYADCRHFMYETGYDSSDYSKLRECLESIKEEIGSWNSE